MRSGELAVTVVAVTGTGLAMAALQEVSIVARIGCGEP